MSGEFDFAAAAIRKVVEDWVVLRDSGRWEEFARVWHDDGWMTATWFQGPYTEFIAVSRSGFEHGVNIAHFLGGFSCEIAGNRAIAQTKMKIEQRATVDGTEVDVTCSGRFYDFLELRDERWGIVRRQPIYEKDRLDVVDPSASLKLDQAKLASFPYGYRHLGYVQEAQGQRVLRGLPGLRGPEVELLYGEGADWLAGSRPPACRSALRDSLPVAGGWACLCQRRPVKNSRRSRSRRSGARSAAKWPPRSNSVQRATWCWVSANLRMVESPGKTARAAGTSQ